jgi:hypothetical protein
MKLKIVTIILVFLCSGVVLAGEHKSEDVIGLLLKENIIVRDSGDEVTKEFLLSCLSSKNPSQFEIKCDDVLFTHHVSYFENRKGSNIALITEDGASVENRWVFEVQGDNYVDIKDKVWPNITDKIISNLLMTQTGDKKYTAEYVTSVAHSNYRLSYTKSNSLVVHSGIPDNSFGIELGTIEWNGNQFEFLPKGS